MEPVSGVDLAAASGIGSNELYTVAGGTVAVWENAIPTGLMARHRQLGHPDTSREVMTDTLRVLALSFASQYQGGGAGIPEHGSPGQRPGAGRD